MRNNDLDLIALLTQGQHDLRARFETLARQPGPQGEQGADGKDGRDGRDGIDGQDGRHGIDGATGVDGKDGRNGVDGARGARGETGPQGAPGQRGAKGEKGDKGDTGPMPAHEWQGTKLRFEKPEGGWGELVELRGPKGARGDRGPGGMGGAGGTAPAAPPFDIAGLPAATSAVPAEFLVQQSGQWARASYAQMQAWFPSGPPVGSVTVDGEPVMVNGEYVKVT